MHAAGTEAELGRPPVSPANPHYGRLPHREAQSDSPSGVPSRKEGSSCVSGRRVRKRSCRTLCRSSPFTGLVERCASPPRRVLCDAVCAFGHRSLGRNCDAGLRGTGSLPRRRLHCSCDRRGGSLSRPALTSRSSLAGRLPCDYALSRGRAFLCAAGVRWRAAAAAAAAQPADDDDDAAAAAAAAAAQPAAANPQASRRRLNLPPGSSRL